MRITSTPTPSSSQDSDELPWDGSVFDSIEQESNELDTWWNEHEDDDEHDKNKQPNGANSNSTDEASLEQTLVDLDLGNEIY